MRIQRSPFNSFQLFKYRLFTFFVILLLTFAVFADTSGINRVILNLDDYVVESQNPLYAEVDFKPVVDNSRESESEFLVYENQQVSVFNYLGELLEGASTSGFILSSPSIVVGEKQVGGLEGDQGGTSIADIIPIPQTPERKNRLFYPDYNIRDIPIIYSTFSDLFNPDGTARDTNSTNSPIQVKLQKGIVHMANSSMPGEIASGRQSSCYIVGHSSNYGFVNSPYNNVFKPIELRSKPGEEFIIFDTEGRRLTFKVFEVLRIKENQNEVAFKQFKDRRVCTLQTSIVLPNGQIDRWLTRGELVI